MNVLIVYHSRTGKTAKVAEALQRQLASRGASVETLSIQRKDKAGFLKCAAEARRRARPEVIGGSKDLSPYDLVFIGFPIWGGSVASPVNSMLDRFSGVKGKKFVSFACSGFAKGYTRGLDQIRSDIERLGGQVVAAQGFPEGAQARLEDDVQKLLSAAGV